MGMFKIRAIVQDPVAFMTCECAVRPCHQNELKLSRSSQERLSRRATSTCVHDFARAQVRMRPICRQADLQSSAQRSAMKCDRIAAFFGNENGFCKLIVVKTAR